MIEQLWSWAWRFSLWGLCPNMPRCFFLLDLINQLCFLIIDNGFEIQLVMCRYSYAFPFLDTKEMVVVDDDRVGPLYEHTFPPSLAPSLSFIGIPRKVNHPKISNLNSFQVTCFQHTHNFYCNGNVYFPQCLLLIQQQNC